MRYLKRKGLKVSRKNLDALAYRGAGKFVFGMPLARNLITLKINVLNNF
jgi:hypothetical protein